MSNEDIVPSEITKTVALIAGEGRARQRIYLALLAANAKIVLDCEPAALQSDALTEANPDAILVIIDSGNEGLLEQLEQIFSPLNAIVLYEEAALVVQRQGSELQRWLRNLMIKLFNDDSIIIPIDIFNRENPDTHNKNEINTTYLNNENPITFFSGSAPSMTVVLGQESKGLLNDSSIYDVSGMSHGILGMDMGGSSIQHNLASQSSQNTPDIDNNFYDEEQEEYSDEKIFSIKKDWSDDDNLSLTIDLPIDTRIVEIISSDSDENAVVVANNESENSEQNNSEENAASEFSIGKPLNTEFEAPPKAIAVGGVLVLGGVGGPDPIRKLLEELPKNFPLAVLVQVRLDGGRYDNLVRLMGRGSNLPVNLAKPGDYIEAGIAYILSEQISFNFNTENPVFITSSQHNNIHLLPTEKSAVIMMSGAAESDVIDALTFSENGGYLAGQQLETCYDSEAVTILAAHDISLLSSSDLAAQLYNRCAEKNLL